MIKSIRNLTKKLPGISELVKERDNLQQANNELRKELSAWKNGLWPPGYIDKLLKVWEEDHIRRILPYIKADCVFDVGANCGQYTEMLRMQVGYKALIISFEPNPAAAAVLREKAAHDPLWSIQECALAEHNGEQKFNIMSGSEFSSLSQPRDDEVDLFRDSNTVRESVTVKTETLESAYKRLKKQYNFKRPFLKMDTQGFDVSIVKHSQSVMREFLGLQSELAIKKLYQDSIDFREALTLYEQLGFSLSAFVPNNSGRFPLLVETDCIMIRSDLLGEG